MAESFWSEGCRESVFRRVIQISITAGGNTPTRARTSRDAGLALNQSLRDLAPFAQLRTCIVLHTLGNLRAFLRAMMLLGLEPRQTTVFYKNYGYPEKVRVLGWIKKHGFEVRPVADITPEYLAGLEADLTIAERPLFVVEDGGYFASAIHRNRPTLLSRLLGTVEQTSRGIAKLLQTVNGDVSKILVPVVSVPDSTLKKTFEPPFIAEGILQALTNLISRPPRQWKVLVLGHGTIGGALAERMADAGMEVTVHDPKFARDPSSLYKKFKVTEHPVTAATGKTLVIGTTGEQSITPAVIDSVSHGTYLASASSPAKAPARCNSSVPRVRAMTRTTTTKSSLNPFLNPMETSIKIVIISGTNRSASNSRRVANHLANLYTTEDVEAHILDLAEIPSSAFTPEAYDQIPPEAKPFTDLISAADGLHVIVPEVERAWSTSRPRRWAVLLPAVPAAPISWPNSRRRARVTASNCGSASVLMTRETRP